MTQRIIILIIVGVMALTGVLVGVQFAAPGGAPQSTPTATQIPSPTPSVVTYQGADGKTALELLLAADPKVVTKGEGASAFVTTIGGYTANDSKKEFWAFYVNDVASQVGAGSYVTKSSDHIRWKIETY